MFRERGSEWRQAAGLRSGGGGGSPPAAGCRAVWLCCWRGVQGLSLGHPGPSHATTSERHMPQLHALRASGLAALLPSPDTAR